MRFHYTPEQMKEWQEFCELHSSNAGKTATMYWLFPPQNTTTSPSNITYTSTTPATGQILVEYYPTNPHPLEPKPEKKCTCGAASCGHNGHSSWCDSLQ